MTGGCTQMLPQAQYLKNLMTEHTERLWSHHIWGHPEGSWLQSWVPALGIPVTARHQFWVSLLEQDLGRPNPEVPHHDPVPNTGLPHADPSYLLLLEVQELHWAQLPIAVPAGSPFPAPAAAAAPVGLIAEAADPVLAGWSGADRLRGGFHHHDVLEGPEDRGESGG